MKLCKIAVGTLPMIKSILLLFAYSTSMFASSPEKGVASWYGKENKISCTGKPLTNKVPALAHRKLPIGSKVRVIDIKTNKAIIAVVEDRGPYIKGRVVDLNYKAAKQLGIIERGIAMVIVQPLSY